MAPRKFASVNHKTRPAGRMAPFRDDTNLVAFRYEQTKQAEPPIPFPPPRNPLRGIRPRSSVTTATSPIIIPPPSAAPPQDQHPMFRTQHTPVERSDTWKRDSGLAPTSSSVTIRVDCDDDYFGEKVVDELRGATSLDVGDDKFAVRQKDRAHLPPTSPLIAERAQEAELVLPTRTNSASKRLAKAFGMRSSNSTKRLKKRGGDDKVASLVSAWGSLKSNPVSPKSPRSPTSPTSPIQEPPQRPPRPSEGLQLLSPLQMETTFSPITTPIPTDSLLDEELNQLSFSKRGSIMFGGKRPSVGLAQSLMDKFNERTSSSSLDNTNNHHHHGDATNSQEGSSRPRPIPNIRLLPVDVERDSQKVRSLYDSGECLDWREGGRAPALAGRLAPAEDAPADEGENVAASHQPAQEAPTTHTPLPGMPRAASSSLRRDSAARREFELAGGLEDWEDVDGADVDRYGFICPKGSGSRAEAALSKPSSEQSGPARKRNVLSKRPGTSNSAAGFAPAHESGRNLSARSLNTQTSEFSTASRRSARLTIRQATNRLPHNKERRWMDEAGEMLSLAPGLSDIVEDEHAGKLAEASKRKESERAEKWRKMAKVIKNGKDGEGMEFEFDTKSQKLVDRTWKGIPDRWRSAAWYSFLATSAKNRKSKETDEHLVAEFHRLQDASSPDDVQIDLDVPRTVNRHLLFRRRYRGGQRLLFRVLHAIALYFPETGYVQGMASLAATLLCYYDEEKCFIMMVRMWRYRGLERLYQHGFDSLMDALKDFEQRWLGGRATARKLTELCIDPTAYGTRWYLTLFNLSIPFGAQLRVWDIFMLLGEASLEPPSAGTSDLGKGKEGKEGREEDPSASLDILHATSAALIDALREVLLDSDFENAMKALTSWIPIKDEEMLMKVTRAEWKRHQGKKKS